MKIQLFIVLLGCFKCFSYKITRHETGDSMEELDNCQSWNCKCPIDKPTFYDLQKRCFGTIKDISNNWKLRVNHDVKIPFIPRNKTGVDYTVTLSTDEAICQPYYNNLTYEISYFTGSNYNAGFLDATSNLNVTFLFDTLQLKWLNFTINDHWDGLIILLQLICYKDVNKGNAFIYTGNIIPFRFEGRTQYPVEIIDSTTQPVFSENMSGTRATPTIITTTLHSSNIPDADTNTFIVGVVVGSVTAVFILIIILLTFSLLRKRNDLRNCLWSNHAKPDLKTETISPKFVSVNERKTTLSENAVSQNQLSLNIGLMLCNYGTMVGDVNHKKTPEDSQEKDVNKLQCQHYVNTRDNNSKKILSNPRCGSNIFKSAPYENAFSYETANQKEGRVNSLNDTAYEHMFPQDVIENDKFKNSDSNVYFNVSSFPNSSITSSSIKQCPLPPLPIKEEVRKFKHDYNNLTEILQ